MLKLPFDQDLVNPQSIIEWIEELGIDLDIQELDYYPSLPVIFSEYKYDPAAIIIYRYLPMEDWLNLISQQQVGYYGPWYFLHITHRIYYHLELHGLYEIERYWYHRLFGSLSTLEERAYCFTREILDTLFSPKRFDQAVERSFQPQS